MTEISDDRSWWADVEHLRPGADAAVLTRPRPEREAAAEPSEPDRDEVPPARRGRITGVRLADPADERPAVLRRADAASFAQAWDIDTSFAPAARGPESREIVLSGRAATAADGRAEAVDGRSPARRPAARGQGSPDRPTVRITGNPGLHADIAERRALREIEPRSSRTPAERVAHRPDRIAMWAVMLGLLLVIIAATSSSAGIS
ncbi:MAG: hypothetical protein JWM31_2311 [Solirubrobacterales bacterium]|nr:hypothetical protein [Solirubrobacterales bacterium]